MSRFLDRMARNWLTRRQAEVIADELHHYTDSELTELGFSRGDIGRIALADAAERLATRGLGQLGA